MITDSKEKDQLPNAKPEGNSTIINSKTVTFSKSRLWSGLKDPRIVRVSRAFGGKDRHSKVSTIRGLRDRRVRLSVPTAIQLYDLQDRLGLNQPSKVVDWLLNATQHEINKLPPLDFPLENSIQFHQPLDQASKAKNNSHDLCLNFEGEHQLEMASAALTYQEVGIYNAQSSCHQDQNVMYNNSRGGEGGEQGLGLIGSGGFPYASYYHWPDQSNRTYFSPLGIISSQGDVAPTSAFPSNYMTVSCDQLDGISAQQKSPSQQ